MTPAQASTHSCSIPKKHSSSRSPCTAFRKIELTLRHDWQLIVIRCQQGAKQRMKGPSTTYLSGFPCPPSIALGKPEALQLSLQHMHSAEKGEKSLQRRTGWQAFVRERTPVWSGVYTEWSASEWPKTKQKANSVQLRLTPTTPDYGILSFRRQIERPRGYCKSGI